MKNNSAIYVLKKKVSQLIKIIFINHKSNQGIGK